MFPKVVPHISHVGDTSRSSSVDLFPLLFITVTKSTENSLWIAYYKLYLPFFFRHEIWCFFKPFFKNVLPQILHVSLLCLFILSCWPCILSTVTFLSSVSLEFEGNLSLISSLKHGSSESTSFSSSDKSFHFWYDSTQTLRKSYVLFKRSMQILQSLKFMFQS